MLRALSCIDSSVSLLFAVWGAGSCLRKPVRDFASLAVALPWKLQEKYQREVDTKPLRRKNKKWDAWNICSLLTRTLAPVPLGD